MFGLLRERAQRKKGEKKSLLCPCVDAKTNEESHHCYTRRSVRKKKKERESRSVQNRMSGERSDTQNSRCGKHDQPNNSATIWQEQAREQAQRTRTRKTQHSNSTPSHLPPSLPPSLPASPPSPVFPPERSSNFCSRNARSPCASAATGTDQHAGRYGSTCCINLGWYGSAWAGWYSCGS